MKKNRTFILKFPVYNSVDFPTGTIVKITDDYWRRGNDPNTGFTVVQGKLKGKKGCVANGLDGYLIENNSSNRKIVTELERKERNLEKELVNNRRKLASIPNAKILE